MKFVTLFNLFLLLSFLIISNNNSYAQMGSLDLSFNPADFGNDRGSGPNFNVEAIGVRTDGKIVIGGFFSLYDATARNFLVGLNADGTVDFSFSSTNNPNGYVRDIAVQADGKIIISGDFTTCGSVARSRIARLNPNGTIDGSFNPGLGGNQSISKIHIQSDGKILIGGSFSTYGGVSRNKIARLNADGSLDTSFNPGNGANGLVRDIEIDMLGKIVICGEFTSYNSIGRNKVARINSDGSLDTSFISPLQSFSTVHSCVIVGDGKIVIVGWFVFTGIIAVARLNNNGSVDTSFTNGSGPSDIVYDVQVQADGKLMISGSFSTYNGVSLNRIARLNIDGSLDTSFTPGSGANSHIYLMVLQTDGKILIEGDFSFYGGTLRKYFTRINPNGSLDVDFNPVTGASSTITCMARQPDGKILIGGAYNVYNGIAKNRIARLNPDGSLDLTFNPGLSANNTVRTIKVQSDGKILIGGEFTNIGGTPKNYIARLNQDGTLDTSFNIGTAANSHVKSISIQQDNKILIGGDFNLFNGLSRNRIIRLNVDGTADLEFNPGSGANALINKIEVQADGKIFICGEFFSYNGNASGRIARINNDGSYDLSFMVGTGADNTINSFDAQPDGKIIIGGLFTTYKGNNVNRIVRLNTDGNIDTGFMIGTGFNSTITDIKIQNNDKVLVGGSFTTYNGNQKNRLIRLNNDGTVDAEFQNGTAANGTVSTLMLQNDSLLLVGGAFTSYNTIGRNRIMRVKLVYACDIEIDNVTYSEEVCAGSTDGFIMVAASCSSCLLGNSGIRYSLDSINFTNTTGTFNNLSSGIYKVHVRDNNYTLCNQSYGPFNINNLLDNENPIAICPAFPIELVLDISGNGIVNENALALGNSTDNCLSGLMESSPLKNFSCLDAPSSNLLLTASDASGNIDTISCIVNIILPECTNIETRTWTGNFNTDWTEKCNWSPPCLPVSQSPVVIPDVDVMPVILNGKLARAQSLVLQTGATLTVQPEGSFVIEE
jgi:uncharacterized delta-60 repeat protein